MNDVMLNTLIKAAYTNRQSLRKLQEVARQQTEAILAELTARGISEYSTPEHKAAIRTKSQSRFDTKAATEANAEFVKAHTVVKTYESVQIL